MATIIENIQTLQSIKTDIKDAILSKGGSVGNDFRTYGQAIKDLPSGGGGRDEQLEAALIEGTISINYVNSKVKSVRSYAFYGEPKLKGVELINCSNIGSSAFGYCYSLSKVLIPDCQRINLCAFYNCSQITEMDLPICSYIGNSAFYRCSKISVVSIPLCSSLYGSAFYGCSALQEVYLNKVSSVTYLASSYVFYQCNNLKSIYVPRSLVSSFINNTSWKYFSAKITTVRLNGILHYSYIDGTENTYEYEEETLTSLVFDGINATIIDDTKGTIAELPQNAFSKCTNLQKLNIPNCTIVGSYALYGCSNLQEVDLTNCTKISSYGLVACPSLTSISLPNLSYIAMYGLQGTYVSDLELPVISNLGSYTLLNGRMERLNLPNCEKIGAYAISQCRSLKYVSLPKCSALGGNVFFECAALPSLTLPVCSIIGNGCFHSCTNLSILTLLSNSVVSLYTAVINLFYSAGIDVDKGSIYVPQSLVEAYKADSYWSYLSNRIFPYVG